MKKRLLASVMSLCMILSLLPVSAFAEKPGGTPESEPTCICETKCAEGSPNEECSVCSAKGADLTQCMGVEEITEPDCTCETKCAEGSLDENCPVCGAEGADLTQCAGTEAITEPVCTCETKCAEGSPNAECLVCGGESADLTQCVGVEEITEPDCTCEIRCSEGSLNEDCPVCGGEGANPAQCKGQPQAEPNLLTEEEDSATEYAMCSYESADRTVKSECNVTLSEAVEELNEHGGGTITVTSSGLAGENNIKVTSDITIIAETSTPVVVTTSPMTEEGDALFLLDNTYEAGTRKEGMLTLGKEGLKAGTLTFDGANQEYSCIATASYGNYGKVTLYDGVVLTRCTMSTLSSSGHNQHVLEVTMYGGQITGNTGTYAVTGSPFYMYGGEIFNNKSTESTVWVPFGGSEAIFENAYIHNNTAEEVGGIEAYGNLTLKGGTKIENCVGTGTAGGVYVDGNLTMEGDAQVSSCTGSLIGGCYAYSAANLSGTAAIMNCTSTATDEKIIYAGGLFSFGSITIGKDSKIIGCSGPVGGIVCGVVWADDPDVTVTIEGEVSKNSGVIGGGISAWKGVNVVIAENAKVMDNTATKAGGGIAIWNGADVSDNDAGIQDNQKTILTLNGGIISGNTAPLGGGVYVAGTTESAEIGEATSGQKPGPCFVTLTGGTITDNRADNPTGGTATEFHGGGMFLGWDVETTISGVVSISGNADQEGTPSNLYLRKDPSVPIPDPDAPPVDEMTAMRTFFEDTFEREYNSTMKPQLEEELERMGNDDLKAALIKLELIEQGAEVSRVGMEEIYFEFEHDYYRGISLFNGIESLVKLYRAQNTYVPSYSEFVALLKELYIEYIRQYYRMSLWDTMDETEINELALKVELIKAGETYSGTKRELLSATVEYATNHFEELVSEEDLGDLYQSLWETPATGGSTIYDARLHVIGSLAGSDIQITAEGAQNGRVVAVGEGSYTISDTDLAAFKSNDPGYQIIRNSADSSQLMLKRIEEDKPESPEEPAGPNPGDDNPGSGNQGGGSGGGSDSGDSDPTGNLSIELDVNGGDDEFTFTVIFTDKDGDDLENNFYYNGDYTGTIGSGDEITLTGGDKIVIRNLPKGTRYEVIIETADGYTYVIDGEEGVIHTGMNEAEFTATRTVPVADPSVTGVSRWLNTTDHIAYLTGYPGGAFGPDNNMTRADVAPRFSALLDNKNVTITKTFPDVPADAWYAAAVNTLASLGMVSGDENGNYRPNDPITRAEFCVIALAFAYEPENAVCYFGDVSRSDWFYTYVAQAASYGWIGGYTNGNFGPNDRITRAQVTTIVNNMLGRAADRDYVIDHQADLVQFTDLTRAHWGYFQIMEATNAHDYTKSNGTENWR